MAGEYTLKNGVQTDWTLHDSTWKKGVDENWKLIDWRLAPSVNEVITAILDLPVSPADGDAYLILDENQVWVWNDHITDFTRIDLSNPFIFYNEDAAVWYQWISGVASPLSVSVAGAVPIGGVIPFQDYDILPLPFGYWWCDNTVISAPGSPIDGQTADDMSGLSPVGYGAIGSGDISTETYDSATVGNANNQIALNHTHTISHTHEHVHTHDEGDLFAHIALNVGGFDGIEVNHTATDSWTPDSADNVGGSVSPGGANTTGVDVTGDTGGASDATTGGSSNANSGSNLSATTNIQPEQRRFKWIMRVL